MQFLAMNGSVGCPACGTMLALDRELDRRVAHMSHSCTAQCPCSGKTYRIDRHTGYGEQIHEEESTKIPVSSRRVTPQWSQR